MLIKIQCCTESPSQPLGLPDSTVSRWKSSVPVYKVLTSDYMIFLTLLLQIVFTVIFPQSFFIQFQVSSYVYKKFLLRFGKEEH